MNDPCAYWIEQLNEARKLIDTLDGEFEKIIAVSTKIHGKTSRRICNEARQKIANLRSGAEPDGDTK